MAVRRVIAFSLLGCGVMAVPTWLPNEFQQWAKEHGKQYRSQQAWRQALGNYMSNEEVIKSLNSDPDDDAEYGHTRFSDMSPQEFQAKVFPATMDSAKGKQGGIRAAAQAVMDLPSAVDWRAKGAVTPVKDQTSCGSCWAESAVGNIESQWFIANNATMKAPVPLSVEEVIECDAHDDACYGGFPRGAFQYVIENGGLGAEADYPYDVDGNTICLANQTFNETCGDGICDDPPLTNWCDATCSAKKHKNVAKISSWKALPEDEDQIAAQVATGGPVSIGIDASGGVVGILFPWLQFYKKGVAKPKRCTKTVDHAVLIVGYGEDNGQKYWTVKNSWGAKWGEDGYFRLFRGASLCGVDTMATTSVVNQADMATHVSDVVV